LPRGRVAMAAGDEDVGVIALGDRDRVLQADGDD
jgi:hypothetical protein